jgi:hypothetical protein
MVIDNVLFEILTQNRGVWSATPWDYSSLRGVRFRPDKNAELIYGYGQTIYALIKARFEIKADSKLRLVYLESPPFGFFKGFIPNENDAVKEVGCLITGGNYEFVESIIGKPCRFEWKLTINESIFPATLQFPYEVPLEFYGSEK